MTGLKLEKEIDLQNKKIVQYGIIFFLILPFIVLLFKISDPSSFDLQELVWSLKNTLLQASLSSFFSLVIGFILALGLLSYSQMPKVRPILDIFILLPNFFPSLFIIVGIMNMIDPFPIGIIGIILTHIFINTGLAAIYLRDVIQDKLGQSGELALVLGSSRFRFIRKILIPQIKQDLLEIFIYIFSVCFSSFAIPLVIGGGRGTNLEILIYEKIRISGDLSSAVIVALVQTVFLFLLSLGAFKSKRYQSRASFNFKIISSKYILLLFVVGYFYFFTSYFKGVLEGAYFIKDFYLFKDELLSAIMGSVLLSVFVGILILLYLLLLSYVWEKNYFAKFLLGYVAPSSALTALAFIILGPNVGFFIYIKIAFSLMIIYSSLAYRLGWNSILNDIEEEKRRAHILGADDILIFKKITVPLVLRRAFFIAGLCAFWTSGEFAVSKIIGQGDFTLAMLAQTFIAQYRLGLASILTIVLLILGVLIFILFIGVGRVISKKIKNSI